MKNNTTKIFKSDAFSMCRSLALASLAAITLSACSGDNDKSTDALSGGSVTKLSETKASDNCVINSISLNPKSGTKLRYGSKLDVTIDYTLKHSVKEQYVRFNAYLAPEDSSTNNINWQNDAFKNGRAAGHYVKTLPISIDPAHYHSGGYAYLIIQHNWGSGCDDTYQVGYVIE